MGDNAPVYGSGHVESAWAAGFLESERGLRVVQTRGRRHLQLVVWESTPDPLERLAALLGGQVRSKPPDALINKHRYVWSVFGRAEILRAFDVLLPNLSEATRQRWLDAVAETTVPCRPGR